MSMKDQAYFEFLQNVRPFTINLTSSSAKVDRPALWQLYEKDSGPRGTIHKLEAVYALEQSDDESFDVKAVLSLNVGDGEDPPLSIACEFQIHLHHEKGEGVLEFARRFAETEARLIAWPYFREFISNTSVRMGIPPVSIPLTLKQLREQENSPGKLPSPAVQPKGRSNRKGSTKKKMSR